MRALIAGRVLGPAPLRWRFRFPARKGAVGAVLLNMAVFGAVVGVHSANGLVYSAACEVPRNRHGRYVSPLGIAGAAAAAVIAGVTLSHSVSATLITIAACPAPLCGSWLG